MLGQTADQCVHLLCGPQRSPTYKAKLFWLVFFPVKTGSRNWFGRFPAGQMVFGAEFPGKKRFSKFNFGIS